MSSSGEVFDTSIDGIAVRGFLHRPENPASPDCLILTHGAGSNCQSPLLVAVAQAFAEAGLAVTRCDLPFRQQRPTGPPPRGSADRDQQGLAAAVTAVRRQFSGRILLGGHSYGGRQASMLAAAQPGLVEKLLLLSYPLHPPQRPDELRTAHFPSLHTLALFVHGTADGFGTIAELTAALGLIPAPTELMTVAGAGHELIRAGNRRTLPASIVAAFQHFSKCS